jgi:hypothetical protein
MYVRCVWEGGGGYLFRWQLARERERVCVEETCNKGARFMFLNIKDISTKKQTNQYITIRSCHSHVISPRY